MQRSRNVIIRDGVKEVMPGKFFAKLRRGDIPRIEAPGEGGYGEKGNGNPC
ncbi:MAG: hypothetical protein JRH06_02395 [Deltaproteobacteria bacterium]|nr:hypothetical protein [Deltaproteobacteria bacterium]MBW2136389.1 hypothetical protein [Deltaproteobacteria bacterium]